MQVRDGILKELIKASGNLVSTLEKVLGQLPGWTTTVGVTENLFWIVSILFGDTTDKIMADALASFNELSGGSLHKIECEIFLSPLQYPF